jgi:hypothetical protein
LHEVIVERFIASFKEAPAGLVLDFDATDDPVHGRQEGRFVHGYYDHYCFLVVFQNSVERTKPSRFRCYG